MIDEEIKTATISALRREMRTLLERNPAGDRRKVLEKAIEFERQKLELRFVSKSDDPDTARAAIRAYLEDAANEIRASW
jgi:hypothetical protein